MIAGCSPDAMADTEREELSLPKGVLMLMPQLVLLKPIQLK